MVLSAAYAGYFDLQVTPIGLDSVGTSNVLGHDERLHKRVPFNPVVMMVALQEPLDPNNHKSLMAES